jgi:hypothetical protein
VIGSCSSRDGDNCRYRQIVQRAACVSGTPAVGSFLLTTLVLRESGARCPSDSMGGTRYAQDCPDLCLSRCRHLWRRVRAAARSDAAGEYLVGRRHTVADSFPRVNSVAARGSASRNAVMYPFLPGHVLPGHCLHRKNSTVRSLTRECAGISIQTTTRRPVRFCSRLGRLSRSSAERVVEYRGRRWRRITSGWRRLKKLAMSSRSAHNRIWPPADEPE